MPFLGIPNVWRNWIVAVSGLLLFLVYIYPIMLKKLKTKSGAKKTRTKFISSEIAKKEDEGINTNVKELKFNEGDNKNEIDKNEFKE